ncbi:hypothetical protein McpSp1_11590 [Methanocorpusculaceae archaeon Sp1]|nr:hypothetical protein [Methanocorpusculaceae archaeon Sp1]
MTTALSLISPPPTRYSPPPLIHAGDYAAWYKHATGEWIYDFASGQITNRRTGRLVPFRVKPNGYLEADVIVKGVRINVRKHRAIWVAAHGILAIPVDYALEVDHINHNRFDCRLENLRLVRPEENRNNRVRFFDDPAIREIRRRHREESASFTELAREFGVCHTTISRIVKRLTYKEVSDD